LAWGRQLLALAGVIITVGCSASDAVNALVPSTGYRVVKDLAYGDGPRRKLDIYLPEPARIDAPMVVFFYGGSWQGGSKETYLFLGQALASKGYIVVVPDYRVYPEVVFPDFLDDAAAAVQWTKDHAGAYAGDAHRLFLMGHSAGAYIAAMLTLDREWLGRVGMDPARDIRATVGLAGPYDFLPLRDDTLKTIFGPEDQLARTQPITYADGHAPPMFLAAGTADKTVDPGNTSRLADRIRSRGGEALDKFYPGITHVELIGATAAPIRFLAPVLKDVVDFLDKESAPLS
jgi:acetyl esterase/lipase